MKKKYTIEPNYEMLCSYLEGSYIHPSCPPKIPLDIYNQTVEASDMEQVKKIGDDPANIPMTLCCNGDYLQNDYELEDGYNEYRHLWDIAEINEEAFNKIENLAKDIIKETESDQ